VRLFLVFVVFLCVCVVTTSSLLIHARHIRIAGSSKKRMTLKHVSNKKADSNLVINILITVEHT
jgi:hypothetical protein